MLDSYGRNIDYVRISITDRCNLRCVYCMPERGIELMQHQDMLSYEQIERIVKAFAALGVHKIKVTGGEPLARKHVYRLIAMLKAVEGIESVTLTTNGVLLSEQVEKLGQAGLDAVNISLDTLDPKRYREITRIGELDKVLMSIEKTLASGISSVKINCVPMKGINDGELCDMAALAKDMDLSVRFIEMMPIGFGREFSPIGEEHIKAQLEACFGSLTPLKKRFGNGPAHYFHVEGFQGRVGFISAISHEFCEQCNRVRLTADGFLKTCLQYNRGVPLKGLLDSGCSDSELKEAIRNAVLQKPKSHSFTEKKLLENEERKNMAQIGG